MTIKRVRFLQDLIQFVGLGERLHLEWISSAEARKFAQVASDFTEKICALGPSPLAEHEHKITAFGSRVVSHSDTEMKTEDTEKLAR